MVASDKIQKRQPGSAALALASREDAASPPLLLKFRQCQSVSQCWPTGRHSRIDKTTRGDEKEREREKSVYCTQRKRQQTNQPAIAKSNSAVISTVTTTAGIRLSETVSKVSVFLSVCLLCLLVSSSPIVLCVYCTPYVCRVVAVLLFVVR